MREIKNHSPIKPEELKKLAESAWEAIYIQQDPLTASRTFEEETVIVTSGDGMTHTINETGTFLWQRARGHARFGKIVDELCEEYDVEPEKAREDAKKFVITGVEARFLRASTDPFPPLPFED